MVDTNSPGESAHLFVLIHGLWGSPKHMLTIERLIQDLVPPVSQEKVVTLRASSFSFWRTYDGIEINAKRVISEIFYEIETLKRDELRVNKISIAGYSLGGLIARNVVGLLHELGVFNTITPVFFTTFATPHVGVEFFKQNAFDYAANRVGKYLFGKTGLELFIADGEQLLVKMADPADIYMQGLGKFQKHILLANIKYDRSVAFFTSYITEYSPFDDLGVIKIKYIRDLPRAKIGNVPIRPKFVDLQRSQMLTSTQVKSFTGNIQEQTSYIRSNKYVRYLVITLLICFFLPIWIPLVLTTTFFVSIYSIVKIMVLAAIDTDRHWKKLESTVYGSLPVDAQNAQIGSDNRVRTRKMSRSGSFKGESSKLAENSMGVLMYEEQRLGGDSSVFSGDDKSTDNLIEDSSEILTQINELDSETDVEDNRFYVINSKTYDFNLRENDKVAEASIQYLQNVSESTFPLFNSKSKLKLDSTKKQIVENLNQLDWIKIPVYIDAWNSHDGIVARRGPTTNPKGTSSVGLYCSILRNHLKAVKD